MEGASTLATLLGAATLFFLLVTGGCGYSLRGTLPSHIKTVAVPVLVNRTPEPAVEGLLTRAIVEAFSTNGRLKIVSPEDADAILDGEVTGYALDSIAFDPAANVRQYRLTVTLNLRFRDMKRNEVLFQQSGVQERADFQVLGAVADTISREESALRLAAVDIARAIVTLAVERF
ncbi:MAG: LptE family protein [Candidatus Rokubacteria bacterium]|nr:LptE family protein [Candidatus Rokubacteria bacterium]